MRHRDEDSGRNDVARLGNKNPVHGIYLKNIQFPRERDKEFTALHKQLKKEFFPAGRAEREEVLSLAIHYYHKHTLYRLWQCEIMRFPAIKELISVGGKSWREVR
jgi:hypothetical protein